MAASAVGIDIGGTKVAAARFDDDFVMLDQAIEPTPGEAVDLADVVITAARRVWDRDVIAVGAGSAGLVRWPEGILAWVPHVKGGPVDLRTLLGEELEVPVVVDHDANVAALAEFELGAARGYDSGLLVTVGTGIGGGFIIDGEIHRGRSFAGEIGHMQLDVNGEACPCGARGCWETLASGAALARLAAREVLEHPNGAVATLAAGREPRGEDVSAAADAGDEEALAMLREVADWLGAGLANMVAAFDPEVIVVGGGLGSVADHFLAPARRTARKRLYAADHRPITPILSSEFGPEAGLVGAGLMAWREVSFRFRFKERTRRLAERSGVLVPGDREPADNERTLRRRSRDRADRLARQRATRQRTVRTIRQRTDRSKRQRRPRGGE